MKTRLSILLLLMSILTLNGQAPFPKKDEINQFIVSKTCVVLESDRLSIYNTSIKNAVENYWNITPYEFIDFTEFEKRQYDPDYSFILLTQTIYDKDKAQTEYNFLNLLQGKNVDKLGELPEICAIPLSFADDDEFNYSYKFGAILLFMQQHAKMIYENPSLTGRRYLRYYNINTPKVKQKTILVKEEDLSPAISAIDGIRATYPHKIEIVDEETIMKAIQEKTPNTLILHKVGPAGEIKNAGLCFKMLIGTDDSDMYYYHQHRITKSAPDGLLPADLKRMAK